MNTRIEYLYRDGSNYKVHNECVIEGELTEPQQDIILACRDDDIYFIPSDVGLPEVRFDSWDEQYDHDWFELYDYAFSSTDANPDVHITAAELVEAFLAHKEEWENRG